MFFFIVETEMEDQGWGNMREVIWTLLESCKYL